MLEYINVLITGESQRLLQREWELRVFMYLTSFSLVSKHLRSHTFTCTLIATMMVMYYNINFRLLHVELIKNEKTIPPMIVRVPF